MANFNVERFLENRAIEKTYFAIFTLIKSNVMSEEIEKLEADELKNLIDLGNEFGLVQAELGSNTRELKKREENEQSLILKYDAVGGNLRMLEEKLEEKYLAKGKDKIHIDLKTGVVTSV